MNKLYPNSSNFSFVVATGKMLEDDNFSFAHKFLLEIQKGFEQDRLINKKIKSKLSRVQYIVQNYTGEYLDQEKALFLKSLEEEKRDGKNSSK